MTAIRASVDLMIVRSAAATFAAGVLVESEGLDGMVEAGWEVRGASFC